MGVQYNQGLRNSSFMHIKNLACFYNFRLLLFCITKSVMKNAVYSTAMTRVKVGQCCHTNLEGHNMMQLLLEWLRAAPNPHVIPFASHNDEHDCKTYTSLNIALSAVYRTLLRHSPHKQCSKCLKWTVKPKKNSGLRTLVCRTCTKVVWHYLFWIYYTSSYIIHWARPAERL
jgi:hypothetical protein